MWHEFLFDPQLEVLPELQYEGSLVQCIARASIGSFAECLARRPIRQGRLHMVAEPVAQNQRIKLQVSVW